MVVGSHRHAPASLPPERTGTHCIGGWVGPRAGLDGCRKPPPTGIRSPDCPAPSESLYRGPPYGVIYSPFILHLLRFQPPPQPRHIHFLPNRDLSINTTGLHQPHAHNLDTTDSSAVGVRLCLRRLVVLRAVFSCLPVGTA